MSKFGQWLVMLWFKAIWWIALGVTMACLFGTIGIPFSQSTKWLQTAVWEPYTIADLLKALGSPRPDASGILGVQKFVDWVLALPAILGLIIVGGMGFCAVIGIASAIGVHERTTHQEVRRVFSRPIRMPHDPEMGQNRLMNRKTRELALLCIIAATSGMLAWTLDRPLTAMAFAAVATFMAICLVSIAGQSK
jgi:hypothetical protein